MAALDLCFNFMYKSKTATRWVLRALFKPIFDQFSIYVDTSSWFLLPKVFFKHFARQNQLPSLSVSGTLVKNGLIL